MGVPLPIISDRGTHFTSHFWEGFSKGIGTQVYLIIDFHPQIDGQEERTIHNLEGMLTVSSINFKASLYDHLPLIEFSYNNSYYFSI